MKKIFIITLLLLVSFAPSVFAHTHLESSAPENGQVITEELHEITLTFGGEIEQGSTFELIDSNEQTVSIEDITASGNNQITGTIPNDLQNGSYTVVWNIISADGHQLDGEFSFSVNIAETETSPDENNNDEEELGHENVEDSEDNLNKEDSVQNENQTENDNASEQTAHDGSSNLVPVIAVILILVIVVIFFVLRRKK